MQYAAKRLSAVTPSASMAVSGQAAAMKKAGVDVIDLGVGEPDFDTPAHIVAAAHAAAMAGRTRYTPTQGAMELRVAVVEKFVRENDLQFSTDEIIISNGAKQVIFDALMATLEPGQEVILCAPHFDTYRSMVNVLGAVPVTVPCPQTDGFRLTPEALEASITGSTRWLVLNLPSNPAGATYSAAQLQALAQVLERHPQVLVLSDEIYEHIVFDQQAFVSFLKACPELRERVLTVNGVSKSYAMTGWRIGYGAGPVGLIKAMTSLQSQISSGASSISQAAATAALTGSQACVVMFRDAFERRRNIVVDAVDQIPGLTLDPPGGAFYTLIGCAAYLGSYTPEGVLISNDEDFVQYLLHAGRVAAVPGSAYGLSPFFRFSTAASDDDLLEAMQRLADCCSQLTLQRD